MKERKIFEQIVVAQVTSWICFRFNKRTLFNKQTLWFCLENTPGLFEGRADFGAGEGGGEWVVADTVRLLCVVHRDTAWKYHDVDSYFIVTLVNAQWLT